MPFSIRKVGKNKYQVYNTATGEIHSKGTTKKKAEGQFRVLQRAIVGELEGGSTHSNLLKIQQGLHLAGEPFRLIGLPNPADLGDGIGQAIGETIRTGKGRRGGARRSRTPAEWTAERNRLDAIGDRLAERGDVLRNERMAIIADLPALPSIFNQELATKRHIFGQYISAQIGDRDATFPYNTPQERTAIFGWIKTIPISTIQSYISKQIALDRINYEMGELENDLHELTVTEDSESTLAPPDIDSDSDMEGYGRRMRGGAGKRKRRTLDEVTAELRNADLFSRQIGYRLEEILLGDIPRVRQQIQSIHEGTIPNTNLGALHRLLDNLHVELNQLQTTGHALVPLLIQLRDEKDELTWIYNDDDFKDLIRAKDRRDDEDDQNENPEQYWTNVFSGSNAMEGMGLRMRGGVVEPAEPYVEGETDSEMSDDDDVGDVENDPLAQPWIWNGQEWQLAIAPQAPMEEPDFDNEVIEGQGLKMRGRGTCCIRRMNAVEPVPVVVPDPEPIPVAVPEPEPIQATANDFFIDHARIQEVEGNLRRLEGELKLLDRVLSRNDLSSKNRASLDEARRNILPQYNTLYSQYEDLVQTPVRAEAQILQEGDVPVARRMPTQRRNRLATVVPVRTGEGRYSINSQEYQPRRFL